jgi:excisionase family DNA binding protein
MSTNETSRSAKSQRNDKLMLTVDETAEELGVSRAHVYNLIARRRLRTLKLGRSRRIPLTELERLAATAR